MKSKTILITGGCGLLGSDLASLLSDEGYQVIVADILSPNETTYFSEATIDNISFVQTDVTKSDQMQDAVTWIEARFGKIDALVHAAYPKSQKWGTAFEKLDIEFLSQDLATQLGGAIMVSQIIMRQFLKQGHGVLVHISSIQGVSAPKFEHYENIDMVSPIEYSAIKAGVISLTKYLAKYYFDRGIRVNCVSPGGILDGQNASFLEKYRTACNTKGMLEPRDINETIKFLVSDASAAITGQNLIVDDGWTL